jgi:exodeoxyribonuclease V alpha subunit
MEQICGYIERITFHNSENGYTVAQLQQPNRDELTCVVGFMPGIQPRVSVALGNGRIILFMAVSLKLQAFV